MKEKIGFGSHLQHAMSRSDPPLAKSAYLKQAIAIDLPHFYPSSCCGVPLNPTSY